MSGVHRFLSRREKKAHPSKRSQQPDHFGGVFTVHHDPATKPDKDEARKSKGILERLHSNSINSMVEANAVYALRVYHGDPEAAYHLLTLLQDTYEGILLSYSPTTRLLGAVNRENVTCYLDALLFAMYARLDSFDAMLYDTDHFDEDGDARRKKLAGLLRLWVNLLRTGRLITTDITAHLQATLAECGWADAARLKQQDPSEAFTFITGQLKLPLLTLKMDLYHTGKPDPKDDHKFVNERLLEVAILDQAPEGRDTVTLEDCLEQYFNNRIEIKRHLENQRRNTLKSAQDTDLDSNATAEKESTTHIEVLEVEDPVNASSVASPAGETPTSHGNPLQQPRPNAGRKRADSIFSQRQYETIDNDPEKDGASDTKSRKLSTRTEVLMPAWQFFKLLPWYTDHIPTSDVQVAAHFSRKRPVLGICLKRYSYTSTGQSTRNSTPVDIPLEIGVPDFVSDDTIDDAAADDGNTALRGSFRLVLQSVVCHRGVSLHAGHYICLCRGTANNAAQTRLPSADEHDQEQQDPWMRFDDLAHTNRVNQIDIRQALRDETPYLLFYQVQPIGISPTTSASSTTTSLGAHHVMHGPPSYAEATSRTHSHSTDEGLVERAYINPSRAEVTGLAPFAASSARTSLDLPPNAHHSIDGPRGRSSLDDDGRRRRSIAFDERGIAHGGGSGGSTSRGSLSGSRTTSLPRTPQMEERQGGGFFLSVKGSRRGQRGISSGGIGTAGEADATATSITGAGAGAGDAAGTAGGAGVPLSRPTSMGPPSGLPESSAGSKFMNVNLAKLTRRSRSRGGDKAAGAVVTSAVLRSASAYDRQKLEAGSFTPSTAAAPAFSSSAEQLETAAAVAESAATTERPSTLEKHAKPWREKVAERRVRKKGKLKGAATAQDEERECSVM